MSERKPCVVFECYYFYTLSRNNIHRQKRTRARARARRHRSVPLSPVRRVPCANDTHTHTHTNMLVYTQTHSHTLTRTCRHTRAHTPTSARAGHPFAPGVVFPSPHFPARTGAPRYTCKAFAHEYTTCAQAVRTRDRTPPVPENNYQHAGGEVVVHRSTTATVVIVFCRDFGRLTDDPFYRGRSLIFLVTFFFLCTQRSPRNHRVCHTRLDNTPSPARLLFGVM